MKDSFWRRQSSPTTLEKVKLLKEKHQLQGVQKQEMEFMDNLKDKIGHRYKNLQAGFDKQYIIEK